MAKYDVDGEIIDKAGKATGRMGFIAEELTGESFDGAEPRIKWEKQTPPADWGPERIRLRREAVQRERLARRIADAYNPNQPRHPKGSDKGGQWVSTGGGGAAAATSGTSAGGEDKTPALGEYARNFAIDVENGLEMPDDAEFADFVREIKEADVCVAFHLIRAGKKIADDGRFKTQHEVEDSNGLYAPDKREGFETFLWPDHHIYPTYGFLTENKDTGLLQEQLANSVFQYGDTVAVLKEDMHAHTTFTVGDSLNNNPWDHGNPRDRHYGIGSASLEDIHLPAPKMAPERYVIADFYQRHEVVPTPYNMYARERFDYIEAQIHQPVDFAAIKEIRTTVSKARLLHAPNASRALLTFAEAGIPVKISDGGMWKDWPLREIQEYLGIDPDQLEMEV